MTIANFFLSKKINNFINFKECLSRGQINNNIISFKKVKEDEVILLNYHKTIDRYYWNVFNLKRVTLVKCLCS